MICKRRAVLFFIGIMLISVTADAAISSEFSLRHPIDGAGRTASGDGTVVLTNQRLPLLAQVVPNGDQIPNGVEVRFVQVSPSEQLLGVAAANVDGIAELESVASSEIHLDLMDCLRKMNSYSANVARALVQRYGEKRGSTDTAGVDD